MHPMGCVFLSFLLHLISHPPALMWLLLGEREKRRPAEKGIPRAHKKAARYFYVASPIYARMKDSSQCFVMQTLLVLKVSHSLLLDTQKTGFLNCPFKQAGPCDYYD